MRRALCVAAIATLASCVGAPPDPDIAPALEALGEPVDGFPSWEERVVWVWANRARVDPTADLADCDTCADAACYGPTSQIGWSHELARAARFHADQHRLRGGGLSHDSLCDIVDDIDTVYTPGPCDGSPACACVGGEFGCAGGECNERFDARVRRFGAFPRAENIAGGASDPVYTFYRFLHEPYGRVECDRMRDSLGRTNGHRMNILTAGPAIGVGIAGGYQVQDFGGGPTPSPTEGLIAGVHYPNRGPSVEWRANWSDDAAPARATVNIDGTCHPMTLERGAGAEGTYLATQSIGGGCIRYFFEFDDTSGETHYFPSTGAYGIGCDADWTADRPAPCDCVPACDGRSCGGDGCGGTCGRCAEGQACQAGQCVCDGAGCDDPPPPPPPIPDGGVTVDPTTDAGAPPTSPPRPAASPGPEAVRGRCAASVAGAKSPEESRWLALVAVGVLGAWCRRRTPAPPR